MRTGQICFIDFETTGIDVFRDMPLEFGAVLMNEDYTIAKEINTRIRMEKKVYLTKTALGIHNITLESTTDSPTQKEILLNFFSNFGTEYRFAGWNINFDVSFFRKMCNKNGFMVNYNKINHRHLDVQTINYCANQLKLFPNENLSLSQVAEFFNIKRSHRHSALEDARITMEVYIRLLELFKSKLLV